MNIRELTCIGCPMGCQLTATLEDGVVTTVTGNTCPRGDAYARKECIHPARTVTGTVRVLGRRAAGGVRPHAGETYPRRRCWRWPVRCAPPHVARPGAGRSGGPCRRAAAPAWTWWPPGPCDPANHRLTGKRGAVYNKSNHHSLLIRCFSL